MAYNPTFFIDFADLKIMHFHAKAHTDMEQQVSNWIAANPTYKYVDAWVEFVAPSNQPPPSDVISMDSWYNVEVTILYTEG